MGKRKWNYIIMKEFVQSLNYELLDIEYKGIDEKITIKDKDGYFYYISLYNLTKGFKPNKFDKVNIYTKNNILLWLKLNNMNYTLLDYYYKNKEHMIKLKDNYGYLYLTTLHCIYHRNNRPYLVSKINPYTIQNIKLWLELNNKPFELISSIYEGDHKKLKWKCLKEDCGEIFEASWGNIVSNHGCGYCSGIKVGLSNCLATKNPELAKEWHPIKNGDLTPYDVTCGNDKKVWWQCSKNPKHEWKTSTAHRNNGTGCPYCAGRLPSEDYNLLVCDPELINEWNYNKNNKKPEEYVPYSHKKVWWICSNPNCKHEWFAEIKSRYYMKYGCPVCSKSKGEKVIDNYLICTNWLRIAQDNFNNIVDINKYHMNYFIPQKTFEDLVGLGNGLLSYDFYIPKLNILIEFHGMQHEKFIKYFHKSKKDFEKQLEHDKRKREYADKNNIKLIEIWYYDFNKIEEVLDLNLGKELKK